MTTEREIYDHYKITHTWPRGLRARLIERENGKCAICFSQQQLSVHHIHEHMVSGKSGGKFDSYIDHEASRKAGKLKPNFNLNGLLLLCGSCHGKIHTTSKGSPFAELFKKIVEDKRNGTPITKLNGSLSAKDGEK